MPEAAGAAGRDTLELACDLVSRASITPTDAGCLDLIAHRLTRVGFVIERLDRGGVGNLWARRGVAAPLVCFAGHVDVVPPGPLSAWTTPPFEPSLRDGFVYGRGIADMKASVAAMTTALERFATTYPGHRGSMAMLLTSDEEGSGIDGTVAVVDALHARGDRIEACVLGEPTSVAHLGDTIKIGRRGSLNGRLIVRGTQGHVAYPALAENPIHRALPALNKLAAMTWDKGTAEFDPSGFQIASIHAGTGAVNVIPGTCEIVFNIRYSPVWTEEALVARVRQVLDRERLDYAIDWTSSARPFVTPPGRLVDAVRDAVSAVTGQEAVLSTSGGTSDGRFLNAICNELVEFGPLNETIHKVDERIAADDLEPLSRIYEGVLTRMIGDDSP